MARKRIGQMSWVDGAVERRLVQRRDRLGEIASQIDWRPFERLLSPIHSSTKGEASYPPLMMFKVLLLQRWYALSDPAMEEALYDRLSFRRFAGLALEDDTPDHSTIFRFRDALTQRGLMAPLLAELTGQLDGQGAILKQGTLIDATLIQSAARRPRKKEDKISPVDPDARFGTNNEHGRFQFGYKLHVAVDAGSGLVRGLTTTPANVQEITRARELIQGDEQAVYADRGYDAEKRSYHLGRVPHFSLARNATALALACFAFNLRRYHVIATP